jgi:hypothetical protein
VFLPRIPNPSAAKYRLAPEYLPVQSARLLELHKEFT